MRLILILAWMSLPALAAGLEGKVLCGYQGWFRVPEDGSNNGWHHYGTRKRFEPGHCTIDLWPDVREVPAAQRYRTPFRHADGSIAEVYSPVDPEPVDLHFRWMREYGIDGVFLQRFVTTTRDPRFLEPMDQVLRNCAVAAGRNQREWALMYDLSGLKSGESRMLVEDLKRLVTDKHLIFDSAYLHHDSRPLISLWGLGFKERETTLGEWNQIIDLLKSKGLAIMVGVPSFWRTLERDAIDDPGLHDILEKVDIISPWTVGRYRSPEDAARHARKTMAGDIQWCEQRKIDYLPVAFPGFSWHNMKKIRGEEASQNAIPRRKGQFLWSQAHHFHQAGAGALYVAMFDEVDEGTAIFKVRQDPPTGASPFVSEEGLPSDHYLWLTGRIGAMLRGEPAASGENPPSRK